MTIHNALHNRFSAEPSGYMPDVNLAATKQIDPRWDDPSYDYLGDTYSSHVNPLFWYLHGWVDSLIDRWAEANRVSEIAWTGTWVGKLEPGWDPQVHRFFGLKRRFLVHGRHDHHGPAEHREIKEMEELVAALGSCGVIKNFYDALADAR